MVEQTRCVYVASGQIDAQQIRGFLEGSGVPCMLFGETLSKTHGLTVDGLGRVEVQVAAADEERALALLASAEAGELRLGEDADVDG
jgi:hypothetical protein